MKPQRAFAPVAPGPNPYISIRHMAWRAMHARFNIGAGFDGGWEEAKSKGWRIRPVLVTLEEEKGK